ncbi:hypothetical protein T4A_11576, partial [Trichinella pseudospiralis]
LDRFCPGWILETDEQGDVRAQTGNELAIEFELRNIFVGVLTTVDANPSAANWDHLHGLKENGIDVLIRIDFYNRLLSRERIVGENALPEAVNSPFGWIVSGNIPSNDGSRECFTFLVKAENEYDEDDLRRNLDELVRETHSTLTSKRIEWKHITSRAPWCGGYREHLVRSVKTALRKVLGRTSLDEEELATVLCGIEAQLFERVDHLTFPDRKSVSGCTLRPITSPTNIGYRRKSNKALVLPKETDSPLLEKMEIRERQHIVLIAEDNANKGRWMMGRVLKLFYGTDGIVRSVQLKVANSEMIRPMKKLRLLKSALVDGARPSSGEDLETPPEAYLAFLMPMALSRLTRDLSVKWERGRTDEKNTAKELLTLLKAVKIRIRERYRCLDFSTRVAAIDGQENAR